MEQKFKPGQIVSHYESIYKILRPCCNRFCGHYIAIDIKTGKENAISQGGMFLTDENIKCRKISS